MALIRSVAIGSCVFLAACGVEVGPAGTEADLSADLLAAESPLANVDFAGLPLHDARELIEAPTGATPSPMIRDRAPAGMVSCVAQADLGSLGQRLAGGMALVRARGPVDLTREVLETGSDDHGTYSTPCAPMPVDARSVISVSHGSIGAEVWSCDVSRSTFTPTSGLALEAMPDAAPELSAWYLVSLDAERWVVVDRFGGDADTVELRDGRYRLDAIVAESHRLMVGVDE